MGERPDPRQLASALCEGELSTVTFRLCELVENGLADQTEEVLAEILEALLERLGERG